MAAEKISTLPAAASIEVDTLLEVSTDTGASYDSEHVTADDLADAEVFASRYGTRVAAVNAQSGTSYTLDLTDEQKMVELDNASPITLTVPTNANEPFQTRAEVHLLQTGAGQVTVVGDSGVTVNARPGLKLAGQWGAATLVKRGTNLWVMFGDLTA